MEFNRSKLASLEARAKRLRDLSNVLDERFFADREVVVDAERELERQRKERRRLGGGVAALHVRTAREARERLERTTLERAEVSESLKRGRSLITRCYEYMLNSHGLDLKKYANEAGDGQIVFSADEVSRLKRAVGIPAGKRSQYIRGVEAAQEKP